MIDNCYIRSINNIKCSPTANSSDVATCKCIMFVPAAFAIHIYNWDPAFSE